MKFLRYHRKTGRSPAPNHQIRLHALRLSRLFENIREFYSLLDDGEDKSSGEYILDFQYVSSLFDKLLAQMNTIVHDACMLAPEGGEDLYLQLDSSTRLVKRRFMEAPKEQVPDPGPRDDNSPHPTEPEYILLRRVLDWMNHEEPGPAPSCAQLLHNVVDHVFQQRLFGDIVREKIPYAEIDCAGTKNVVSIVNLEELPDNDVSGSPVEVDTPTGGLFGLVTIGIDREGRRRDAETPRVKRWLAVVDYDSLSLILTEPGTGLLLTAKSSGDPGSDFIFVLCGDRIPAEELLPSGFRIEKTPFGCIGCKYAASTGEMDDYLALLGNSLFGMSQN